MKKIVTLVFSVFFLSSIASAEMKYGLTGSLTFIDATGSETEGGEKTREIPITTGLFDFPTGKKKKVTEAEYWDYTYGKTHSTTSGLPLNTDKLLGQ